MCGSTEIMASGVKQMGRSIGKMENPIEPKNGNAEKVIKKYFDYVDTNVYLTVRNENIPANKFYEKVGMEKAGFINWSNGNMKGTVWLKVKN